MIRPPALRSLPVLRLAPLLLVALAAACDGGPGSGPGPLTASVVSPNGAEGAAVLELVGPGIQGVAVDEGRVWSGPGGGDTVKVVLVADAAGALSFRVQVADTLQRPEARILQVAGPDDVLREDLSGYAVEVGR